MKKFEILEHKADLEIRVCGKTKEELFKNALLGMQNARRAEVGKRGSKIKKKIEIKSDNINSLLVDFLSEVNYLNETEKEIYNNMKILKLSDKELAGDISGNKVEWFGLIIKGVTYHNLEIKQEKNGSWQATILFDI